ncbi:MAG: zinc-binding dehydrogenase [SAR202 cluster bacterium]|nr:zinc-binding dehydrogenase [SAR202 cluster bacterium]
MPMMTAALYDGKSRIDLVQLEKPEAGPGDAVVRVRCTGICGSDLLVNAEKMEQDQVPAGHEVAGQVVEVGDGVDRSLVGRRVAVDTIGAGRACLECRYCRQGQYRSCADRVPAEGGGFAQFMRRRATGSFALPDSLSWEEAGLVEPLAVSVHAVRRGRMAGGETVAVLGAGNIGLTAVAAARALGAGKVLASARHPHQAAMARTLGADDALSPDGGAFQDAIEDATDGLGADFTIETVGGKTNTTLKQAIEVTRTQGRIVVLGGFHAPITLDWIEPLLKEQSIVFSSCYSVIDGRHDYEVAIDLLDSCREQLEQMVTHRYPLERIQDGFDTAYDKTTGSIKVQIHQGG